MNSDENVTPNKPIYTNEQKKDIYDWSIICRTPKGQVDQKELVKRFTEKYPERNPPNRSMVRYLVKKMAEKFTLVNQKNVPHKKWKRTEENIQNVKALIKDQKSIRNISKSLSPTQLSKETVRRILKEELQMFPYKVKLVAKLHPKTPAKRLEFCRGMLDKLNENPDYLDNIWFSDESHFHLDGYVNRQNMIFWATEDPNIVYEREAHPQYVTVWAAISKSGLIGPYFFENAQHERVTVNKENYTEMIRSYFIPELERRVAPEDRDKQILMQDGAPAHTAKYTLEFLKEYFGSNLISLKTDHFWPATSCDLNPCDYQLWNHMKMKVFNENEKPKTITELKDKITLVFSEYSDELAIRVIDHLKVRLYACIQKKGQFLTNVDVRKATLLL